MLRDDEIVNASGPPRSTARLLRTVRPEDRIRIIAAPAAGRCSARRGPKSARPRWSPPAGAPVRIRLWNVPDSDTCRSRNQGGPTEPGAAASGSVAAWEEVPRRPPVPPAAQASGPGLDPPKSRSGSTPIVLGTPLEPPPSNSVANPTRSGRPDAPPSDRQSPAIIGVWWRGASVSGKRTSTDERRTGSPYRITRMRARFAAPLTSARPSPRARDRRFVVNLPTDRGGGCRCRDRDTALL